ncbi:MAG: hypothetical protein Q4B85_05545 [Lachnospiraceae bacterium]|nr:hypothetical protein [Lachnospiraceae bacterium]
MDNIDLMNIELALAHMIDAMKKNSEPLYKHLCTAIDHNLNTETIEFVQNKVLKAEQEILSYERTLEKIKDMK